MKLDSIFLEAQFKNIEVTYNLKWKDLDEYGGDLVNDLIIINIATQRWEDGVSLGIVNKSKNECYDYFDFQKYNGFSDNSDYLTQSEIANEKKLTMNEGLVQDFRILLERHCKDILLGDFSKIGRGEPF